MGVAQEGSYWNSKRIIVADGIGRKGAGIAIREHQEFVEDWPLARDTDFVVLIAERYKFDGFVGVEADYPRTEFSDSIIFWLLREIVGDHFGFF